MWGPISDRILPILRIFWDLDFLRIVNTHPPTLAASKSHFRNREAPRWLQAN